MAITNLARFTINGTPSEDTNGKRGYDAGAGESLAITLEANPALGVLAITYDVFDSAKTSSPLNSLYASALTFVETGAKSFSSSSPNTTVHITVPPTADISSYTIRATAITATGAQLFERLLCVRKNGLRMTIPAESLQYAQRGWSDALNELTKLVADGGVSVSLVSSSATGTIAAFPAAQRRIFHSDGATSGGVWTVLSKPDLDSALAASSVDYTKLVPGTEGYVLRTTGGAVIWGADVTLNRPTNPGQNGYVATGLNGDLSYILIGNAQIATNAGIEVTKIAPGTSGYVLKTVGSTVQWAEDLCPTLPIDPTDDGKVPLALGGDFIYGYISNTQIASDASIAVTKLATGTEGYVLTIIGGIPSWSVAGGGGTNLPSTPGDNFKLAFANAGNLDYADGVKLFNPGSDQNGLMLSGALVNSSSSIPIAPVGTEYLIWSQLGALKWSSSSSTYNVLLSNQPIDVTDNGKAAIARNGFYAPEFITNESISATAGIVVTKLAPSSTPAHVLLSTGGIPTWGRISDTNIASNADITVYKLGVGLGADGDYLKIVGSIVAWSSTVNGMDIASGTIDPISMAAGAANTVLITNASSNRVWSLLANANISTTADISVTKLHLGSANSILASNGTSNNWTEYPIVETCTAMQYFETSSHVSFLDISVEPSSPAAGCCDVFADNAILKGKFNNNTVWEIATQALT